MLQAVGIDNRDVQDARFVMESRKLKRSEKKDEKESRVPPIPTTK